MGIFLDKLYTVEALLWSFEKAFIGRGVADFTWEEWNLLEYQFYQIKKLVEELTEEVEA